MNRVVLLFVLALSGIRSGTGPASWRNGTPSRVGEERLSTLTICMKGI